MADPPGGPFVSVLTAPDRGAIAVLRVWGRGAIDAADAAFRPHRGAGLAMSPPNRPRVGRLGAETGDEVVAIVAEDAGRPPEAEIQCHGGPAAVALVLGALEGAGASRRSAEDWLAAGAESPLRAAAEAELAHAETVRAARHLLAQAGGALDRELGRIADRIVADPGEAIRGLEGLIRAAEVGMRLTAGWRVLITGRPNVGKSRLLNAIAGYGRAIVSPTPGTTRDVVTLRAAIEGWPVEFADTAGLRESDDPIEAGGVGRARALRAGADLILLVLDRSRPLTAADRALLEECPGALVACNKSDLPPAWGPSVAGREAPAVSAERGDGLPDLMAAIARRLVPDPPREGAALPFRADQRARLIEALDALRNGRPGAARAALAPLLPPHPGGG